MRHASKVGRERDQRALRMALVLTASFLGVEIVGGILANSLALLSDAAHMFTDVVALGLASFAVRIAGRPATDTKTYGYHRAEILVALLNGLVLWVIVIGILWKAWERLLDPPEVLGGSVAVVAAVGLVVNLIAARMLSDAASHNLNVRGALLHVVADVLGSLGALVAGGVILITGWTAADAVASVVIGALVLFSSWTLVREAVDILMEAVPRHIDLDELRSALEAVPGTNEVHDLHVWSLTTGRYALSAHAVIAEGTPGDHVLAEMTERLATQFAIDHVTIQLEGRSRRHAEPAH